MGSNLTPRSLLRFIFIDVHRDFQTLGTSSEDPQMTSRWAGMIYGDLKEELRDFQSAYRNSEIQVILKAETSADDLIDLGTDGS